MRLRSTAAAPARLPCRMAWKTRPSAPRTRARGRIVPHVAGQRLARQKVTDLVARQGLVLQQPVGDRVQILDMVVQDLARPVFGDLDDAAHFESISRAVSSDMFCCCETE